MGDYSGMLASIVGIGIAAAAVVGAVVFVVLFFRKNPKKQALVNSEIDKISKKL
jgi:hypothetical protein